MNKELLEYLGYAALVEIVFLLIWGVAKLLKKIFS